MARYGFGSCGSDACEPDRTPQPTFFMPAERLGRADVARQAALFAPGSLTAMLLAAAPIGAVVLNEARQIVYANPAFAQLSEWTPEILGLRLGEALLCEHGTDEPAGCGTTRFCALCGAAQATRDALRAAPAGRAVSSVHECRLVRAASAAGPAALDLRVWTHPFTHENEPFVLLFAEDIAHEKRREVLERLFFKTMGAGLEEIHGLVGLLQVVGPTAGDRGRTLMAAVEETSAHLLETIAGQEQLLEAERGELEVEIEALPVRPFLSRIVRELRDEGAAQGRRLDLAEQVAALTLHTDSILLERVLRHMLVNGLEAAPEGTTVTAGCDVANGDVRFWVHNPGAMPREVQLQVFQRSFSTHGAGRGLGTYMMKLLSERYLDGVVTFTSTPEAGTVFSALYPLRLHHGQ